MDCSCRCKREKEREMYFINILSMRIIPEKSESTVTLINSILIHNFLLSIKAKSECYLPKEALWFSVF